MLKKNNEPQYYMSAINNPMLNYRVYIMTGMEKFLYNFGLFVIGGIVGLIFYGGMFKDAGETTLATHISNAIIFVLIGIIANRLFIGIVTKALLKKRLNKLRNQFRDFLSALSNSLSSGMNVNDSLINAYNDLTLQYSSEAYIVKEVQEMINGVQNNIAIEDVLMDFGKRSGLGDISNFSSVFATCYRTGGNLKHIIRRTTEIITQKIMIESEIETKITSNKMQLDVMCCIPIFIMLLLKNMSSDFAESFSSVLGAVMTTISIAFFVVAYIVGNKIMDIKG